MRELIEDRVVEIVFVKTLENVADGFTKNVSKDVFEPHTKDYVWDKVEVCNVACVGNPAGRVLQGAGVPQDVTAVHGVPHDVSAEHASSVTAKHEGIGGNSTG